MNPVLVVVLFPVVQATPVTAGVAPAAAALERALATAGVERGATVDSKALSVAGFTELRWRDAAGAREPLRFATLPGVESWFAGAAGDASPAPWFERIAVPNWGASEPLLELAAVSGREARGVLRLPRPAHLVEPVTITRVTTGCSMTHSFELPLRLEAELTDLEFRWDLHSPLDLERRRILIESERGVLPLLPVALRAVDPGFALESTALGADPAGPDELVVSVRPTKGAAVALRAVTHPACLDALGAWSEGAGVRVRLRENGLARSYHACNLVRLELELGDDPEPYARFVRVRHLGGLSDPAGRSVLYGVFAPGERVVLLRDAQQRLELAYPDRVACLESLAHALGLAPVAELRMPAAEGPIDLVASAGARDVRLIGVTSITALDGHDVWSQICAR